MTNLMSFAPTGLEQQAEGLLHALPTSVYKTDRAGRIVYYNEAAAAMWGRRPEFGESELSGALKLFQPDGTSMPYAEWPTAVALRERRPVQAMEVVAERSDGARTRFLTYCTPQFDGSGAPTGVVTVMVEAPAFRYEERSARHHAAIVESSDDAILSKDLDGVITTWNQGAERLFGYTADEAVGKSVTILIPEERHDEEPSILGRIRRGERIDHYETIRQHKDGSLIDISLTVSPIKDSHGRVVGASKIARDISERKRSQEQQRLLLREMDHRVRNLFAISSGLVVLSARSAKTPAELATKVRERLSALARAHALVIPKVSGGAGGGEPPTTLQALIRTIISPYDDPRNGDLPQVSIAGPDLPLSGDVLTGLALLLHEFATNAAKYGALSTPAGSIEIACSNKDGDFLLEWTERGGPRVEHHGESKGFGSLLVDSTVKGQLNGDVEYLWAPEGLTIRLSVPRDRLAG
jgi:PAS domain S-box-containing protein